MTDDELKRLFDANAAETKRHFDEKTAETQLHVEDKVAETQRHFDEKTAELRHFFELTAEGLRHEIRLVAEGVEQTREVLTRTSIDLSDKIERVAIETQAMIKFSHDELHRRVRTLEDTVADLQTRVERLEGATH